MIKISPRFRSELSDYISRQLFPATIQLNDENTSVVYYDNLLSLECPPDIIAARDGYITSATITSKEDIHIFIKVDVGSTYGDIRFFFGNYFKKGQQVKWDYFSLSGIGDVI